jgi:(p)ppGpp synthase/HD superfamily hydrolase
MDNIVKGTKLVKEAKMIALRVHGNQNYDLFPYIKHLEDVVDILMEHGYGSQEYLVAGYLHDSLEDAAISFGDIKKLFGEEIAEIVYAVTDELGRNRKERKGKVYPKIRQNPKALIIKLADRIANIEHSLRMGSSQLKMYLIKEHDEFENALKAEKDEAEFIFAYQYPWAEGLWDRLERVVENAKTQLVYK